MASIHIKTNLPVIKIELFKGTTSIVIVQGSSKPIPFFAKNIQDQTEITEDIIIPDLQKGLYSMRISLPYFSGYPNELGKMFPMPIVMDKSIILEEGTKLYFNLSTTFEQINL